jgi:hypothetical protein
MTELLVWRFRRWRARHHEHAAWVNYLRWPTPANAQRLEDYARKLDRIDAGRP